MSGGGTELGSGWLPVDALDDLERTRDAASRDIAERLLGLPPRARVLELMRLAAAGAESGQPLRSADLIRVLESFEGAPCPAAEELCRLFPGLVADRPA